MNLLMFKKIFLPYFIHNSIPSNLSSINIIPLHSLAILVAVLPNVIPTEAVYNAIASLLPSPTYAVVDSLILE